jgi:hypothetical protein
MKTLLGRFLVVGLGMLVSGLHAGPPLPVITSQPTNELVVNGGTVVFSVTATNPLPPYNALTYQWQLNGVNLPASFITTMAGGNLFNHQPATNVILNSAAGVVADALGNCFIADTGNHVIRKVDTNGVAVIIAGTGSAGFSGDGGAATNAALYIPNAVALDLTGNLFIADTGNNRIRKVDTNGIITTVAGNGSIYSSGDNGAATNAGINPYSLCLDGTGNLFIAEEQNNRIRKVGTNGMIFTVAGNGTAGYSGDGGAATKANLNYPAGVALDAAGNLLIEDAGNQRVRLVATNNIITTVAGNGTIG